MQKTSARIPTMPITDLSHLRICGPWLSFEISWRQLLCIATYARREISGSLLTRPTIVITQVACLLCSVAQVAQSLLKNVGPCRSLTVAFSRLPPQKPSELDSWIDEP